MEDEDSNATDDGVCSTDVGDASPVGRSSCWQACTERLGWDPNTLASVAFVAWVVNGLLVYTLRPWGEEQEPYTVIEALYVMAQIITTVGYGDKTPALPRGMVYTSLYVLFAIVVLSSLVTALADNVLKGQHEIMEKAIKNSFHLGSKIQRGSLTRTTEFLAATLNVDSASLGAATTDSARSSRVSDCAQVNDEALEAEPVGVGPVELPEGWMALLKSFGVWAFMVVVGAVFMLICPGELDGEDFYIDVIQAFYFSVITLTTVGFGDICPKTQMAKLFCTFWMLLGVTSFASFVSSFSAVFMAHRNAVRLKAPCRHMILEQMDRDQDGKVDQSEFLTYMLHVHGIGDAVGVDSLHDIIKTILREFKDLDKDGDGELDIQELVRFDTEFLKTKSMVGINRKR